MNCLEFESQIEVLARGALADARTRAAAEAHAESCAACDARLADERALSVGLRALAAGMKGAEAPAGVETALLAAFRARAASAQVVGSGDAAATSNVVPLSGHAPARRWSWAKTVAVASMAAAASLALFVLARPGVQPQAPSSVMIQPPTTNNGGPPAVAHNALPGAAARAVETQPDEPGEVREKAPRGAAASYTPRVRAVPASYEPDRRAPRAARQTDARPQEVATEFIPLVQAGPYTQSEEGHLVRVEMPRSALASFGLPVSAEAAGERVKADVLMGQDGIARAIRFVR